MSTTITRIGRARPVTQSRAKGCNLDRGLHRYTSFDIAKARAAKLPSSPDECDLAQYAPAVMDQGQTSSCEGHRSAAAIATTLAARGKPLPWVPSPAGIYTLARCIDRDGTIATRLQDTGTETNSVIRAISEFGVRPMGALIADRYSDVAEDAQTLNAEPTLRELEVDARTLVIGAYQVTSTGAMRDLDVRIAIAGGFAVCIDSFVDLAFENWKPGDSPIEHIDYGDPQGGGHAMYIIGYTADYYRVRNSWGPAWGDAGDVHVSREFLAQADVFAWRISTA